MKHLFWSLLGLAELDTLDSIDHTSVTIVHFLYGVFLVLGVILLVNMMIALLNNTCEKVQVKRAFLFNFLCFNIFLFVTLENSSCCRDFRGKGDKKEEVEENQNTRRKPSLRY